MQGGGTGLGLERKSSVFEGRLNESTTCSSAGTVGLGLDQRDVQVCDPGGLEYEVVTVF